MLPLGLNWDEVTALSTAALALGVPFATLGVFLAYRSSLRDVTATREAMYAAHDDSERQLAAAYQPLLVEVLRHGPIYDDMQSSPNDDPRSTSGMPTTIVVELDNAAHAIDPRAVRVVEANGVASISLPLRNVGRGLALIVAEGISVDAADNLRTLALDRPRVPPGETTRITCSVRLRTDRSYPTYTVYVPYRGLASSQFLVAEVRLEPAGQEWRVANITEEVSNVGRRTTNPP
jgi:hypothetical protein